MRNWNLRTTSPRSGQPLNDYYLAGPAHSIFFPRIGNDYREKYELFTDDGAGNGNFIAEYATIEAAIAAAQRDLG